MNCDGFVTSDLRLRGGGDPSLTEILGWLIVYKTEKVAVSATM